ncbi:MAG: efflux RND transporter periplasmic adaptor subunit [Rhodospirillaceae bacterium]|nr:efflux RND transporter periplasmic adaptor subunit [Rhodospirillaceae bacterium]
MKPCLPVLVAALVAYAAPVSAQDIPRPVKLMTVEAPSTRVTRHFFGKVAAKQTVDLAFQTAGQIVRFPAIEGRIVPAGDMIAQLDLEQIELALQQARLQRDRAHRRAARLKKLEGKTVSQVSVEDAATEAGLAEIALRNAEYALKHATLDAPFDALVARRSVARFTTVNAGTPVVRLHDMSEIRIEIDVPEVLFQRAGRDRNVTIAARFPASKTLFPVEVREFNAETSRIGQTFRVTLGMAPPDELNILPGSSVTILATLHLPRSRIAVPASAVAVAADGATSVMVFRKTQGDEGVVAARRVTLAVGRNGEFQVIEGLKIGEEIVAAGINALKDGARVRRFRGLPN